MADLPFLVRHGGWIWPLVLVPFAALGALTARGLARRLDGRREARARALLAYLNAGEGKPLEAGFLPPRVSRLAHAVRLAFGAVLGVALGLGTLALVGRQALASYEEEMVERFRAASCDPPPDAADSTALAVAAATPFHRAGALATLALRIRWPLAWCSFDEARLERAAAAEALGGGCPAGLYLAHGRLERAAETGESCGGFDPLLDAAASRMALGQLERASDDVERAGVGPWAQDAAFVVGVHLAAGRPDRAARAARALAARGHRLPGTVRAPAEGEILACLADALDARRGDGDALRALREPRDGTAAAPCALLLADVADPAERRIVLTSGLPPAANRHPWGPIAAALREEHGIATEGEETFDDIGDAPCLAPVVPPDRRFRLLAVRRAARDRLAAVENPLPVERLLRVRLARGIAAAEADLGDRDEVIRLATAAAADCGAPGDAPAFEASVPATTARHDVGPCCWRCPVVTALECAVRRRDLAEARGDAETAGRLTEALAALRRTLHDRDVAVPLEILEHL